mgnify:CR=1 FL=1|jgi:hypothetical protein
MILYAVYFEIFKRKLVVELYAKDHEHAKQKVRDAIIFHKFSNRDAMNYTIDEVEKALDELTDIIKSGKAPRNE